MTKAEKYKKIMSLAKYHGEIIAYFRFKHDGLFRRRKISYNGNCFMSEGCYSPDITDYKDSQWGRYSLSCFICQDGGRKSLKRTMKLMEDHDRKYIYPIAIVIGQREIKL